ncbi:MAG: glycosyltransferase [Nitrospiraceae bacterium]|nr:glycosyltransferase [Nitrospiraceae bacterium]
MKIFFIADNLGGGGAEQQIVNIANNVNAEKRIFLTVDRGMRQADLDGKIPLSGGYGRRTPLKSVLEIKNLIDSFRPDIVHSFLMYSCFLTAVALKLSRGRPVFIAQEFSSPQDILNDVKFGSFKKWLLKFSYKSADKILTVSKAVLDDMIGKGYFSDPLKGAYIYDGLNIRRYKNLESKEALRKKLGLEPEIFYIAFAGAVVKAKGLFYLINAFRELPHEKIRLLIIGRGEMTEYFRGLGGGDGRIEFLGYKKNAVEYIRASDLFVLPSLHEGLPNVVIEAMTTGTPVISTNVFGAAELIENERSGLLVPPADTGGLKQAMIRLIDDGSSRESFAREAMKKADYFSIERMTGDYESFYLSLLNEGGGSIKDAARRGGGV